MPIMDMNAEAYEKYVAQTDEPVLVEFWAPWCTYCRRLAPALEEIARRYQDSLAVGRIDIDKEPGLAEREKIELVPTVMLYRGGRLLGRAVVPRSGEELEELIATTLHQRQERGEGAQHVYDMIVIGGGPGGYTAALYAARAGLDVVVLEKLSAGGQMALTEQIDNYPGFDQGIDGFTLGEKMRKGAERFGAETYPAQALSLELSDKVKRVETSQGALYGRTVVLAAGAVPRQLGIAGEEEMRGHGVSYCAACDGMFYKGKRVVVVGGGNSAAADALILSRICERVILVHRRDTLRATKIYHAPLMEAGNVEFRWNSVVTGLLYDAAVSGVRLRDVVTGEESAVECDGVFVSIGRSPASELVKGQLGLDPAGHVIADESTRTDIPGVFAVGDVRTKALRQIVTAVADGAVAVHFAQEYLAGGV